MRIAQHACLQEAQDEQAWLGRDTARLRLLITLAATCVQLRQAALCVAREVPLLLSWPDEPLADLPPRYLSSLLSQLIKPSAGDCTLWLAGELAAGPEVGAFLATSSIASAAVSCHDLPAKCIAQIEQAVAGWPISELRWFGIYLPSLLPTRLHTLVLALWLPDCSSAGANLEQSLERQALWLLQGLPHLPALHTLDLVCGCNQLAHCSPGEARHSIASLRICATNELVFGRKAAGQQPPSDVSVQLGLATNSPCAVGALLSLAAAAGPVHSLELDISQSTPAADEALFRSGPDEVQEALSRMSCSLCNMDVRRSTYTLTALPAAAHLQVSFMDGQILHWQALAGRPGHFSLEGRDGCRRPEAPGLRSLYKLHVLGCSGVAPDFQEPWAVFALFPEVLLGLPQTLFHQLSSGWWVWRNSAAAALDLQEPLQLGQDEWDQWVNLDP